MAAAKPTPPPASPAATSQPPASLARRLAVREDARRVLHRAAAERLTQCHAA